MKEKENIQKYCNLIFRIFHLSISVQMKKNFFMNFLLPSTSNKTPEKQLKTNNFANAYKKYNQIMINQTYLCFWSSKLNCNVLILEQISMINILLLSSQKTKIWYQNGNFERTNIKAFTFIYILHIFFIFIKI